MRGATSKQRRPRNGVEVSIHAPRAGGDTTLPNAIRPAWVFQSTPPARGATQVSAVNDNSTGFNPRAPHGARRALRFFSGSPMSVSIHAPRTGRDEAAGTSSARGCSFNPRAPHGARPAASHACCSDGKFQSTRPARGATCYCKDPPGCHFVSIHAPRTGRDVQASRPRLAHRPVSIHAPRTGRDPDGLWSFSTETDVSIHAPRTGRDCGTTVATASVKEFQSTRPARGATPLPARSVCQQAVSIHAPRTGRDGNARHVAGEHDGFNPRAPHGARLDPSSRYAWAAPFQSTRPARGATTSCGFARPSAGSFNPRAPHGARRRAGACSGPAQCTFQSTRPARGATSLTLIRICPSSLVSIHAPRTGRDAISAEIRSLPAGFNPRAPHGARHQSIDSTIWFVNVSIHAPRTGRDGGRTNVNQRIRPSFNPRAPHGARPAASRLSSWAATGFNPRAPHGARRSDSHKGVLLEDVSIHAPRTGRDLPTAGASMRLRDVSIHAPRTGRDRIRSAGLRAIDCFNPRAPHGARQLVFCFLGSDEIVSIHAPRTGRDRANSSAP